MCEQQKKFCWSCCDLTTGILVLAIYNSIALFYYAFLALAMLAIGLLFASTIHWTIGLFIVLFAIGFGAMPVVRVVLFWMAFTKNSKSVGTKDRSLGIDKDSRWCLSTFYIVSWSINTLVYGITMVYMVQQGASNRRT